MSRPIQAFPSFHGGSTSQIDQTSFTTLQDREIFFLTVKIVQSSFFFVTETTYHDDDVEDVGDGDGDGFFPHDYGLRQN